jgi:hypothetical protein
VFERSLREHGQLAEEGERTGPGGTHRVEWDTQGAMSELDGEDVRQHRRTRRIAWSAVTALALLLVVATTLGLLAAASARSENNSMTSCYRANSRPGDLWAPETPHTSRDLLVLVE